MEELIGGVGKGLVGLCNLFLLLCLHPLTTRLNRKESVPVNVSVCVNNILFRSPLILFLATATLNSIQFLCI